MTHAAQPRPGGEAGPVMPAKPPVMPAKAGHP